METTTKTLLETLKKLLKISESFNFLWVVSNVSHGRELGVLGLAKPLMKPLSKTVKSSKPITPALSISVIALFWNVGDILHKERSYPGPDKLVFKPLIKTVKSRKTIYLTETTPEKLSKPLH